MTEAVILERLDAVAVLRLNESATRNAISPAIRERLEALMPAVMSDPSIRCVLITGRDGVFCAGGDIRSFAEPQTPVAARVRMGRSHAWIAQLLEAEKPVITAVNGPAVGAGLGLALLGDIVMAGTSASFVAGFSLIGLGADYALGWTLPRAVGAIRARDILMTGRQVSAQEALDMGMVSRLLADDELEAAALKLAAQLARGPTVALGLTKTLVSAGFRSSAREYLQLEGFSQATAFATRDHAEGVRAFLAKEKPGFEGR